MKNIPIEKCLESVPNVFSLILVAARRARQLAYGKSPKVHYDNSEKPTMISLREIGDKVVGSEILKEEIPVFKDRNNLGFSTPGPLPPLSALGRLVQANKDDSEDSDLRNLEDAELGLVPVSIEPEE
ncbi:MAG: DNA-directed RNA polymerase subunit omega [Proteobacteria bacterium]|nr:DNA-directed RNA polymerase subunit omega [Pseudomonadota bacterium]